MRYVILCDALLTATSTITSSKNKNKNIVEYWVSRTGPWLVDEETCGVDVDEISRRVDLLTTYLTALTVQRVYRT